MSETPGGPIVDLNSDLGEGFGIWQLGDDEALLDVVTSANVACGFHAGDPNILRRVCDAAVSRGVSIGAQVSYHDLAGFGRRSMDVDAASLTNDVIYQIGALDGFARIAGSSVRYVKPHGALYNRTVYDDDQAAAVVAAVVAYDSTLPLLGLPGSALIRHAEEAGLRESPMEVERERAGAVALEPVFVVEFRAQRCDGVADGGAFFGVGEGLHHRAYVVPFTVTTTS